MSAFPQWDAKVIWPSGPGVALDRVTGREAYNGPLGEGGTPDQATADGAWGTGNYAGWTQPDGRVVFYSPTGGWLEQLLAAIDAPLGLVNDQALQLWFNSEGVDPAANNPCATLRRGYGETFHPPWAMPFYPNRFAGQRAWVDTLNEAGFGYEAILRAFRGQDGIVVIFNAINESAWCRGCQGGNYPVQLYQQMVAIGGAGAGGTTASPTPAPGTTVTVTPPDAVVTPPTPEATQQAYNQLLVVVTETLPVATGMLDTIANTKIGGF